MRRTKKDTLLVNAQIEINRAVWAMNETDVTWKKKFTRKRDDTRLGYIRKCVKAAIESLARY